MNVRECIKLRKSVRTYGGTVSSEDKNKLAEYIGALSNPFGVEVEFRFLNSAEHDLSSAVIVGTDEYIAAKVNNTAELFELGYGYSFEALCLYAQSIGVGTVMLGGTLSRRTFEKAMELGRGEVMPLATPIGYPAQKMSMREKMMRGAVKANDRLPQNKLFFENSFDSPLSPENSGKYRDALEMVRLAPSAVNKQPWRVVVCGDTVHFFKKGSKAFVSDEYDLQNIDMGIALAHFDLTLKEEGISGQFIKKEPPFEVDGSMEYIISYEG